MASRFAGTHQTNPYERGAGKKPSKAKGRAWAGGAGGPGGSFVAEPSVDTAQPAERDANLARDMDRMQSGMGQQPQPAANFGMVQGSMPQPQPAANFGMVQRSMAQPQPAANFGMVQGSMAQQETGPGMVQGSMGVLPAVNKNPVITAGQGPNVLAGMAQPQPAANFGMVQRSMRPATSPVEAGEGPDVLAGMAQPQPANFGMVQRSMRPTVSPVEAGQGPDVLAGMRPDPGIVERDMPAGGTPTPSPYDVPSAPPPSPYDVPSAPPTPVEAGEGPNVLAGMQPVEKPMALDQALEQRLLRSITGQPGEDDPVAAAQRADYEERSRRARQQQIEELNRLGILRGGGDTAAILGQFDVGVLRGQQQISADMATRQQEALKQALEMQNLRQRGELGRGELSQAEQRLALDRELGRRELGAREAEMRGTFGGEETIRARELAQRASEGGAERRLRREELSGMTFGPGGPQRTIAAQELAQRAAEAEAERRLAREELSGMTVGPGGRMETVAARELRQRGAEGELERELRREEGAAERRLAREELGGVVYGAGGPQQTIAAQELAQRGAQFETQEERLNRALQQEASEAEKARNLAREELRGQVYDPELGWVDTLGARRLGQEQEQFDAQRLLQEAALTGRYGDQDTLAAREMEQERQLQEAALTGRYGEQDTLAARGMGLREAELYGAGPEERQTLAGQIAAREAEVTGRQSTLDRMAQELAIQESGLSAERKQEMLNRLASAYGDEGTVLEEARARVSGVEPESGGFELTMGDIAENMKRLSTPLSEEEEEEARAEGERVGKKLVAEESEEERLEWLRKFYRNRSLDDIIATGIPRETAMRIKYGSEFAF